MSEWLASGRLVDVALGAIVLELFVLEVSRRRSGRGLQTIDVVGHLLAGALLLAAVRCAVTGASPLWTLAFLGASLPAHLFDLVRRARFAAARDARHDPPSSSR